MCPLEYIHGILSGNYEACPLTPGELTACHNAPFHLGEAETYDFPHSCHAQGYPCYLESSSREPTTCQPYDSLESGLSWSHSMLDVDLSRFEEKTS